MHRLWIFSVLAKAVGEPRDFSKNGRPKEPDLNVEGMRVHQTNVPFDGVASPPFARKHPARLSVSQRRRDYHRGSRKSVAVEDFPVLEH